MAAPSLEPARPATLRLAFAPDLVSARAVSVAIRNFLAEQGVAEKELFSYELCIAEASNNAVEYAEGFARGLKPIAEALFTPSQIELRVTDHTAGFVLPEKVAPPSPLTDRGRGLFLIQSVMDEVRYLRGSKENILVMRKKRRALRAPVEPAPQGSGTPMAVEKTQQRLEDVTAQMARMAEELQLRSETLSSVFRCCAELGHMETVSSSFEKRLLVDLLHLTSADWYVLRMLAPESNRLLVSAVSEPDLLSKPIDLPAAGVPASSIEATVAVSQACMRFDIRESSDPAEPLRAVGPEGAGLVCPLCFGGTLVGTIAVGRRSGDFPLGRLQDDVIRAFAEFLAIQTLNIRRQKSEVRNLVVARELEIAKDIQHLLLPRVLPQPAGFSLAGGWQSASEVGGDFYKAIAIDDNTLLLMIADVMGKGVPAALFATTLRGLMRGLAARSSDPSHLLSSLNALLYKELSAVAMFITAQIVRVELKQRTLTAASAGHCPILFIPPGGGPVSSLAINGLPLGVLPDTVYPHHVAHMGSPTTLLMYTDGLTDTRNKAGQIYGQHRLKAWLQAQALPGRDAPELRDRLATELNRYRGATDMADDQAFIILAELGADGSSRSPHRARRIRSNPGAFLFPSSVESPDTP